MIRGKEFHSILQKIFLNDVKGIYHSEQLQINCPKCQEKDELDNPDGKYNLEINTAKRVFHCWRCDNPKFSGSLGRLIKIFGDDADYELYKSFAGENFNYSNSDDEKNFGFVSLPKEFISFSDIDDSNSDHMKAYMYLVLDRKIPIDIAKKYRMGFCIAGKYEKRIIIPSYDSKGDLNYFVARSYVNARPPYMNPHIDKNEIIFNEGNINWDSIVFLVEGVFEMLSLYNSIPLLGKELSKSLFYLLKKKKPYIVIILDPDAYKKSIEIFQKIKNIYVDCEYKVKLVKLSGNEDLDEIRKNSGIEEIKKNLYKARKLNIDDYFMFKKYVPYERKYRKIYF